MPIVDFALSERSEFAKSRQIRGAQGSPKDQVTRASFFGSFFGRTKNEQAKNKLTPFLETDLPNPHDLPNKPHVQ